MTRGNIPSGLGRKIGTGIVVGTMGLALAKGPAMNIELYKPVNQKGATIRPNLFYNIGKTRGYTWGDFSTDGGYFGKTTLTTPVNEKSSLKTQIIHGNEPISQVGVGATANIPGLPKGVYANIGVIPFWANKEGYVDNKAMVSYYVTAPIAKGLSISSFGEANVFAKDGATWSYGELDILREFPKGFKAGLNFPMTSKGPGKITPEMKSIRIKLQKSF